MSFEITILGSSSATPTVTRHPSAQYFCFGNRAFLIDCGEGAQTQILRFGQKPGKIEKIFISHLHLDHWLGLPGLLSTFSLNGRTAALEIYAPDGLQQILETTFKFTHFHLNYPIHFHTLQETENLQSIFEDEHICIDAINVQHRVPCWAFIFRSKNNYLKIDKDKIEGKNIPLKAFSAFRLGNNFTDENGKIYHYADYTLPKTSPATYIYITDTIYLPHLISQLPQNALLYHETTFMHDLAHKTESTMHSTTLEAAQFAKAANAKQLIIGHFSSRYNDLQPLLQEARTIFENTELAEEGRTFTI
ncbi:MAG: ribonuclease Z [Sphingobacteriales bacterium]|nr:MAG: ribonuclease Z [Sphingobacteriales bacterium]